MTDKRRAGKHFLNTSFALPLLGRIGLNKLKKGDLNLYFSVSKRIKNTPLKLQGRWQRRLSKTKQSQRSRSKRKR